MVSKWKIADTRKLEHVLIRSSFFDAPFEGGAGIAKCLTQKTAFLTL
jgi:hypothetical protein